MLESLEPVPLPVDEIGNVVCGSVKQGVVCEDMVVKAPEPAADVIDIVTDERMGTVTALSQQSSSSQPRNRCTNPTLTSRLEQYVVFTLYTRICKTHNIISWLMRCAQGSYE